MNQIKIRTSNVLSWISFVSFLSLIIPIILVILLGLIQEMSSPPDNLYKEVNTKVDKTKSEGEEITAEDIRDSYNLQKAGALPGDRYISDGTLIRVVSKEPRGEVLTGSDILSSPNLQVLGAEPGDQVINNKLHRAKTDFVRGIEKNRKVIGKTLDPYYYYSDYRLGIFLVILVINYILVGKFRIIPWKRIEQ